YAATMVFRCTCRALASVRLPGRGSPGRSRWRRTSLEIARAIRKNIGRPAVVSRVRLRSQARIWTGLVKIYKLALSNMPGWLHCNAMLTTPCHEKLTPTRCNLADIDPFPTLPRCERPKGGQSAAKIERSPLEDQIGRPSAAARGLPLRLRS